MNTKFDVSLDDESLTKSFNHFSDNNALSVMARNNSSPDNDYDKLYDESKKNLPVHMEMLKLQVELAIQK